MFLCKKLTLLSYPAIAREFGRSDHSTSLHAFRRVESMRHEDATLARSIVEIEQIITAKYPGVA
jgi:chromosomal replication initiator protein